MNRYRLAVRFAGLVVLASLLSAGGAEPGAAEKPKPYRLKAVDLKKPVLWGSTLQIDKARKLTFGGLDQSVLDGVGHTRLEFAEGGVVVTGASLRNAVPENKLEALDRLAEARQTIKATLATARASYLNDLTGEKGVGLDLVARRPFVLARQTVAAQFEAARKALWRQEEFGSAPAAVDAAIGALERGPTPAAITDLWRALVAAEIVIDSLTYEPPPRALTAMATFAGPADLREVMLFGGDHLDYLTNDTWVFDVFSHKWTNLTLKTAPPPRAGHTLRRNPDGSVTLTGGYTYANSTDYMGGQYVDLNDGEWTYRDGQWSNPAAKGVPGDSRTYRTGAFHPDYFLEGDKPDAARFQAFLKAIPVNTWTKTHPLKLPQLNRDWGTAVLDADRGLILRWSGGHCAHGGTDVLHYHIATNRWELTAPVEFPLGQLYTNTEYPRGVSFNRRPWITGHTYQSYALDPVSRKMLSVGQREDTYLYDPDLGDWLPEPAGKPKAMSYGDCFYTLTCCATPAGVYCWTVDGKLFLFDGKARAWNEVKLTGQRLDGSSVDNSTLVHDAKRNRLLFFRKPYGDKESFAGTFQAVDLDSGEVGAVAPANAAEASAIPYLCQIRYDAADDLLLVGATLAPDPGTKHRRTPAYDLRADKWVTLNLTGDDPSGKSGRNVSLGLMYDAPRKLFWATDAKSEVYVLRLDVKAADAKPM